ncbi:LytTR family DNA-binding domain-containing protein [Emticicia sp. BO119]|uniref:LytR/AlgR family response regulator transcription factor n=1 Tax=Emticicia sp. BO119 TaxID=2757768 RepID=UPI0015F0BE8A|nr:LytTR family DNA-binding domain-containing protein [Emticicia sp. BO119]MBA4850608.1 LytTR family transcriptional regulator [Emticicia sp. BO119]
MKLIANIPLEQILFLQADTNYTQIFLSCGRTLISGFNLKKYEDFFEHENFLRANRRYLINRNHIHYYDSASSNLYLTNGIVISVSRRRREMIESMVA